MDLLASEYGWTFQDIMYKTYPEDFFLLQRQIKMRKIDEMLNDVAIVTTPHKEADDAKAFVEEILKQRRFYRGDEDEAAELDIEAFNKFKNDMSKSSILIRAK